MEPIGIGMAGLGTVGGGVVLSLLKNGSLLRERTGFSFSLRRIAVRDLDKPRPPLPPETRLTTNWQELIDDPEIRVIVELMGGLEAPLALVCAALRAGKIVVTGNKALLAEHGREIFQLAHECGLPVFYEAAVAGGIPIIQAVREAFVGNRIEILQGILNGTSNYILTRMQEEGLDFAPALAEAQSLGYAEADPALDINGWDAAHKAIILASLCYGRWISPADVYVEGIEKITAADISFAEALGYRLKLLATIRAEGSGEADRIGVRVCPTLIPRDHVLASVSGVFNAVWLRGDVVGESLFYGRGAGQNPTASAVLADLAEAGRALSSPRPKSGFVPHDLYGDCLPIEQAESSFYLRLEVEDRPGVLAQVAGILGQAQIGISSVMQPENATGDAIPLVLMIHQASFGRMKEATDAIAQLACVKGTPQCFPAERLGGGA